MSDVQMTPQRLSVAEIQAAVLAAHRHRPTSTSELPAPTSADPARPPATSPAAPAPAAAVGIAQRWALVATHGGSGARCLSQVVAGAFRVRQAWPSGAEPAVLVCRSSARGLLAAQQFARAFRDRQAGDTTLLGLLVVADVPGRIPPAVRRLERLVSGAMPAVWQVPWVAQWRLEPPGPATPAPQWAVKLSATITAAAAQAAK